MGHRRTAARKHKRLPEGPFYRDLGRSIRLARVVAGKSQADIARHLDVTFQQVQKYERGNNRIPLDRLISLSAYLDVPLSHFIAPDDPAGGSSAFRRLIEQCNDKEFHRFLEAWTSIKDRPLRAAILNVVRRMAAASK